MENQLSGTLDSEHWGEKIRALRHEEDWSQRDLADRLGVPRSTLTYRLRRAEAHLAEQHVRRKRSPEGAPTTI